MKRQKVESKKDFIHQCPPCLFLIPVSIGLHSAAGEGLCLFNEADVSVCFTANAKYFSGHRIIDGIHQICLYVINKKSVFT